MHGKLNLNPMCQRLSEKNRQKQKKKKKKEQSLERVYLIDIPGSSQLFDC